MNIIQQRLPLSYRIWAPNTTEQLHLSEKYRIQSLVVSSLFNGVPSIGLPAVWPKKRIMGASVVILQLNDPVTKGATSPSTQAVHLLH